MTPLVLEPSSILQPLYLLLGTNLGNKSENLNAAIQAISREIGSVELASKIYVTGAWGMEDQPDFYNQAVLVHTNLYPQEILKALKGIEDEVGRTENVRWGPREIDIDILFYGQWIYETPDLEIPHPQIQNRRFALMPMVDIAEEFHHPKLKKNIKELLSACTDNLQVNLLP